MAASYLKFSDAPVNLALSLVTSFVLWWCIGWFFIGVGAGLIHTRTHEEPEVTSCFSCKHVAAAPWFLHYVGYYLFVCVVVSLVSFVAPFGLFRHTWNDVSPETLGLRALVALVGGFEGWRLSEHTRRAGGGGS